MVRVDHSAHAAHSEIHCGRRLATGEILVWQGRPCWRELALRALGAPIVAGYCVALTLLGLIGTIRGGYPLASAVAPLLPGLVTVVLIAGFAVLIARSTQYLITDRRIILRYGFAMPRNLSLPFSQISALSVALCSRNRGNIALTLRHGNHMPYLKLWPHARPWQLRHPEPMLRNIPSAGVVAAQLSRAIAAAERKRLEAVTGSDGRQGLAVPVTATSRPILAKAG